MTIYYLPKLSEIKDPLELKKEIFNVCKIVLPVLAIINLTIYFTRYYVITIIFSHKFLPMIDLFAFQMIGDFFKVSSWLLSFIMVAKAMTKQFIITEILFSILYVLQIICYVHFFGFVGISYAWASEYFIYTLTMLWLFKKLLFVKV